MKKMKKKIPRRRYLRSFSIAFGLYAALNQNALGANNSVAIGNVATATNNFDVAIGSGAVATGQGSAINMAVAIGSGAQASQAGSIAIGDAWNGGVKASGRDSVAIGTSATASANDSVAFGFLATATQANSVALGSSSVTSAVVATSSATVNGITYSGFAGATPTSTVSIGAAGAERTLTNVAAGRVSATSTDAVNGSQLYSVANTLSTQLIAQKTHDYSINSSTPGSDGNYNNAGASGANALAVGTNASASAANATAMGSNAGSSGISAVAVGDTAKAGNIYATAIGFSATASGRNAIALGANASASGSLSTDGNPANGFALAIGSKANGAGSSSMAIGGNALASGTKALALGDTAASTATKSVAIGTNANSTANGAVAVGMLSDASMASAVAIGNGAAATANAGDVALGSGSSTATVIATNSIEVGGNAYAVAGTSPTSAVSVGSAGSERTITNVAAGRVSATSTDAVNGSELYATNQQVTANTSDIANNTTSINNLANGKTGPFVSDSAVTALQPVASGTDATAGGFGASATGAASTTIGNRATDNGNANATVFGEGASIAGGLSGSSVALGQGSTVTADAVPTASGTIDGATYSYAGAAPNGVVSVGTAASPRQITNVAAGQVSATSVDAVNGSQLYATHQAMTSMAGQLNGLGGQVTGLGGLLSNLGHSVTLGFGGGSAYDAATGVLTTSLGYGGGTYTSLQSVLNQINGSVDGAIQQANANTTAIQNLSHTVSNVSAALATTGKYVQINSTGAGSSAKGNNAIALGPSTSASGDSSIAVGSGSTSSAANSVAMGANAASTGNNSVAIGSGSNDGGESNVVSVGSSTQQRRVTNIANGTAENDAVNVSQLNAAQAASVQYDRTGDGSVDYGNVTLGTDTTPTQIHNVANGTASNDAANVGQLNTGVQAAESWAKNYVDQKLQGIDQNINTVSLRANAGVASAMAMAGLPQAYQPNQNAAAMAFGTFHGQAGVAVGVSTVSESGRWVYKLNMSGNTRGDVGASVGAAVTW
jgi:trimeric autotransporter adhesin